jgi:hypothetical protein
MSKFCHHDDDWIDERGREREREQERRERALNKKKNREQLYTIQVDENEGKKNSR